MTWDYSDIREYRRMVNKQDLPPVIISVAITGGVHGKELNPNLPESPDEQAKAALEARKAGAAIVHIHARDPSKGYASPSTSTEDYMKINKKVRELCPDIIVNNTTGGGLGDLTTEARMGSIFADPEVASLNLGPLAWKARLNKREPPLEGRPEEVRMDSIWPPTFTWGETELFAKNMAERNVKPELEIYHQGQFQLLYNLIDKDLIKPPYMLQFVMGAPSAEMPTAANLVSMLSHAPKGSAVSVIGIGAFQLQITTIATAMGLNIRVGLEDNVYYRGGELAKSNAQLVERAVRIAKELNREVATPEEARKMLNLSSEPRSYD